MTTVNAGHDFGQQISRPAPSFEILGLPVHFSLSNQAKRLHFCRMIDDYLSLGGALGAELQQSMSPSDAVSLLKDGVRRSTSGDTLARSRAALLEDAAGGQYPYAAVLSCIDSRAPVEQIFDAASGDLFVARVAGNVASPDLIASLEYATKYAGSKAILVLGHTRCGAVKGAWAGLEDGHLTGLLGRIQPAVTATKAEVGDEDSGVNLDRCSTVNVQATMEVLRKESAILSGLEAEGKIAIVGGVYDVATGEVAWVD
jgi:carbonic anhydrase